MRATLVTVSVVAGSEHSNLKKRSKRSCHHHHKWQLQANFAGEAVNILSEEFPGSNPETIDENATAQKRQPGTVCLNLRRHLPSGRKRKVWFQITCSAAPSANGIIISSGKFFVFFSCHTFQSHHNRLPTTQR